MHQGRPVRISAEQAERFVARLFELAGVDPGTAATVAGALVEAELEGNSSHGLLQAPVYIRRVFAGTISRGTELREIHRSGAISIFDAGLALGHAAAEQLARTAVDRAQEHGMAAVAVRRATHFGVAGRYARMIAEAGMVGIAMCNTRPMMPFPDGRQRAVGNNPLAIAVPCAAHPPIVFDMAMSAAAMGRIRQAAQKGEPIPPGWAVDAEGHDTTDANAAIAGMLLPVGGAKGFGLALMVDLLCALSGGAAGSEIGSMYDDPWTGWETSWLFLAIDAERFGVSTPYAARVAELAAEARKAAPDPSVAMPGDRKRAARARAGEFITLAPGTAASLDALSRELGSEALPQGEG